MSIEIFIHLSALGIFGVLFLGASLQWFLRRACTYHVDTGFWKLAVLALFLMTLSEYIRFHDAFFLGGTSSTFLSSGLLLMGLLTTTVALLRIFAWNMHRHSPTS